MRRSPLLLALALAATAAPASAEGVLEGQEIPVRLEGAEPGIPGHGYRFSLLMATVTARPAP